MENDSFSESKTVWLFGSLLPILMATEHCKAQIILLGLLNTAFLCVGLGVMLRFLGVAIPKMLEWTKNVLMGGCAVIRCLSLVLLSLIVFSHSNCL